MIHPAQSGASTDAQIGASTPSRPRRTDVLALTLAVALMLAVPVLSPPITHHGEAREGLVVQDIVARGDWILPRRNGELPSKPPLFHWGAAASTLAFGAGDGPLRLPSALAALLVVLLAYDYGRRIGGRVAGLAAGGILLGMVPFLEAASEARVDMVFTATITTALVAFRLWDRERRGVFRLVAHLGLAGAVLAKGPAGAAIPLLVVLAFLASDRRLAALRECTSLPLALLTASLTVGWYVLAWWDGGKAFLHLQLVHENFERVLGGTSEFHGNNRFGAATMIFNLLAGLLPWSLALPWTIVGRLRGRPNDADTRFLHAWWIVVVAVFSFAKGQRPVYVLPAAPAVALLAARLVAAALADDGAGSLLARVTPPAWLRRRTTAPRRALVAVVVAVFDVAILIAVQTSRVHHASRGSLLGFAATIRKTVPADAPLFATTGLSRNETLVLAYRTARAVPHEPDAGSAPTGAYYLVPIEDVSQRTAAGFALVAQSDRGRGGNVALMQR